MGYVIPRDTGYKVGDKVIYIPTKGTVTVEEITALTPAGNPIVMGKAFRADSGNQPGKKFTGDYIKPFNQKGWQELLV